MPIFYMGVGDPNSANSAYMENASLTERQPSTLFHFLKLLNPNVKVKFQHFRIFAVSVLNLFSSL